MKLDQMKTFTEDSITYNLDYHKEIVVGDLAYSPHSDAIVGIDEENVYYANEEYLHATEVAPIETTGVYEVTFREEFFVRDEEQAYDDLLVYLQTCVNNGDVTAFNFHHLKDQNK